MIHFCQWLYGDKSGYEFDFEAIRPQKNMIFAIWATTQHYADFDVQVRAVLGKERSGDGRFEDAARFLDQLFVHGLKPDAG